MSSTFLKLTPSYHSKFKLKKRRRRIRKTDYNKRIKLIKQDKKKFENNKTRLVVRFSKKNLSLQMVKTSIDGDFILVSSYLKDLSKLDYKNINNSHPFSYLLGYYLGKKFIKKLKTYCKKNTNKNLDRVSAILDIGMRKSTVGNKLFAAMKGSVDSGIYIPHNFEKIFRSKNNETQPNDLFDERSKGIHIIKYIDLLKKEDEDKFKKQFPKIYSSKSSLNLIKKNYLISNKLY
mmetsp:Transcript_6559/g.14975  ORF Transcript_6559/g.14975 Transcript_6559/m.14975 type:complete len:233 (-) Transcript_6559:358-1056(-)